MSLKIFFPPSFDSIPCQFQSIRVFHLFRWSNASASRVANEIIEGVNFGLSRKLLKEAEIGDRQVEFDSNAISLGGKRNSNGETINGSVKSISSFNAVANLHKWTAAKKRATVVTMEKSSLRWKKCNREIFPEEIEKYTNSSSSNDAAAIITKSVITTESLVLASHLHLHNIRAHQTSASDGLNRMLTSIQSLALSHLRECNLLHDDGALLDAKDAQEALCFSFFERSEIL